MKTGDRIQGAPRGTAATALSNVDRPERIDRDYIGEVYAVAPDYQIDPAIVCAQWHLETDGGRSVRWRLNGNPAGLLIEDPSDPDPAKWTGTEAAHVHVWALAHACDPTIVPAWDFLPHSAAYFVERWTAKYNDPACPVVGTIDDLNIRYTDAHGEPQATYAWDADYQDKIVERSRVLFGDSLPDQEGSYVPTYQTTIPGLPGGPLKTEYPVRLNMIPPGNVRQRPGIKAGSPRRSVQHGTGNATNPSAMAEAQYFVNGAEGRQASVHYCTDDREAVVVVPLDEVTWQAADGAGPGNMNGYSCEMSEANIIWNDPARRDRLIAITADLMGRTGARLGATVPEQHWTFNAGAADRHDCPNKLRHTTIRGRPAWDVYAERWEAARLDELRRMGQTPTTTTTTTAPPLPPLVPRVPIVEPAGTVNGTFFFGDRLYQKVSPARLKLVRMAVQYSRPDGSSLASAEKLPAGKVVTCPYVVAGDDGVVLYRCSRSGTYILASNFTERRG